VGTRALDPPAPPPGAWPPAERAVRRFVRPVEEFLRTEAAAGIALLAATVAALGWASSPWRDAYHALWDTRVGMRFGEVDLGWPLRTVIDDGLMTLFFFVVGLEIRREVDRGELSDAKRAALPLAAALGGMLVPAGVYVALNAGGPHASGWGVPMATDIAFAVGVLTVLGKRVSPALRILVLALAIIDDVGAILVIGVFYSSGFELAGLAIAAAGVVGVLAMQRIGVRRPLLYVLPAAAVWLGCHEGGVHPTMAGVIVGLLTPPQAWLGAPTFVEIAGRAVEGVERAGREGSTEGVVAELDKIAAARREAISPVDRLQHALHPWVAFGVMPLFAFANAGVSIGAIDPDAVP
jgi:NhaA family Na+:H+ antiporter